jgi:hypothetical protein
MTKNKIAPGVMAPEQAGVRHRDATPTLCFPILSSQISIRPIRYSDRAIEYVHKSSGK